MHIRALVPEISMFEKCVKYANEMTDDVIHIHSAFCSHGNLLFSCLHPLEFQYGSDSAQEAISHKEIVFRFRKETQSQKG